MIYSGYFENNAIINGKKLFLVCGKSFDKLSFAEDILKRNPVRFGEFCPNPKYEDVMKGAGIFKEADTDTILAVGGGSAMDVAKAIKYYCETDAKIIAIPTTAGTGSEVTRFAVIYKDGEKMSLSADNILPDEVILEPSVLNNVPDYFKKTTMLDALCHAIESYWSKASCDESKALATKAIEDVLKYKNAYLNGTSEGNAGMLNAACLAGQAINYTKTTAAHAMCYKLTTLYNLAHGHAVAVCLPEVWKINKTSVPGITREDFEELFKELQLDYPHSDNREKDLDILTDSVNAERLGNNPAAIDKKAIRDMYECILK